jgi:hypothetical protein
VSHNSLSPDDQIALVRRVQTLVFEVWEIATLLRNCEPHSTDLLGYATSAREELDTLLAELRKQPLSEQHTLVLPRPPQMQQRSRSGYNAGSK